MTAFEGSCLCGAVRYTATEHQGGGHCYCLDCRKSSGTSHCSHVAVPEGAFSVSGEVRFFEKPADSGNQVSRGFCPTCGSPVYSANTGFPGVLFVRASSLDTPDVFSPQMNVYGARAPAWSPPDRELPTFEEMPPSNEVKAALD